MKEMKIGIIPNSDNFLKPSDRRKVIRYFKIKKISFEKAIFNKEYDYLYLSGTSDLTVWGNYKKKNKFYKTKIIFDASDPYLSDPFIYNFIRSIYYFLSRKTKHFTFSYSTQFKKILKQSDIVICSSEEQKNQIKKLNDNIYIIRDYFDTDIKQRINFKNNDIKKHLNIFWEGQSHSNISIFRFLFKILLNIKKYDIVLHIVTDAQYCYLGGRYFCVPTINILNKIFKGSKISIKLYNWSVENLIIASAKCDIGLIPIPNKPRMQLKPENKLILMWMLGLPVITSDTKSYKRVMNEIQEDWTCKNMKDWTKKVYTLIEVKINREKYVKSINSFFENKYSSDIVTKQWDNIFN